MNVSLHTNTSLLASPSVCRCGSVLCSRCLTTRGNTRLNLLFIHTRGRAVGVRVLVSVFVMVVCVIICARVCTSVYVCSREILVPALVLLLQLSYLEAQCCRVNCCHSLVFILVGVHPSPCTLPGRVRWSPTADAAPTSTAAPAAMLCYAMLCCAVLCSVTW